MQRGLIIILHGSFVLSVLLIPLLFTSVNEELFEFIKMLAVYVLVIVTLGCYLILRISQKRWSWQRTPLDIPLLLFLIAQVLATVFSIHPATSFYGYYTRFHGGLLSFLAYASIFYVFVNLCLDIPRQQAWRFIKTLLVATIVGGLLVSLYAIPEHFGHSFSCFLVQGSFDVACWVQDVKSRVFATIGQPNWLAAYMILLIPLSSAWFIVGTFTKKGLPQLWSQAVLLVVTFLFYLTLLFTKSRSGFLGLVCSLAILTGGTCILFWRSRQKSSSQPVKSTSSTIGIKTLSRLAIVLVLLGVASLTYGTPFSPSLKDIVQPPSHVVQPQQVNGTVLESGGTESGEIRKIVWTGALRVWRRYPLFGSGLETFAYSYYQDRPMEHNLVSEWNFLYNKAHNEFLNYLATTGIIGLATYVVLLLAGVFLGVRLFWRKSRQSENDFPKHALFPLALVSGLVALSVSNFFGFSTVLVTVLMYFYLAIVSILTIFEKRPEYQQNLLKNTSLCWWQYGVISLIGCLMVVLIYMTLNWWIADYQFSQGKSRLRGQDWQRGLDALIAATKRSPQEALYTDTLSEEYATLAVRLAEINEATAAAEFAQAALQASDVTLQLNPVHLNFYKTRVRILTQLVQLDPVYLQQAKDALVQAAKLAPTDASLILNQARIAAYENNLAEAKQLYETAIRMKTNFVDARMDLAKLYESEGNLTAAYDQYNYVLTRISPDSVELQQKIAYLATASATKQ